MSQVWLCLLISVVIGVVSLYAVLRSVSGLTTDMKAFKQKIRNEFIRFQRAMMFILGLLILQGHH